MIRVLCQAGGWCLVRRAVPSPPWRVPCPQEGHNPGPEDRSSRAVPAASVGQSLSAALSPYVAAASETRPPVLSTREPRRATALHPSYNRTFAPGTTSGTSPTGSPCPAPPLHSLINFVLVLSLPSAFGRTYQLFLVPELHPFQPMTPPRGQMT